MHLIESSTKFDEMNISSRFDVLISSANGKWYLTESEVFVASGKSRVLINALPEICNIVEHFAFESSKATVESASDEMGETVFNDETVEANVSQDVSIMTQGKTRELYYRIREQLCTRFDKACGKASELRYLQNSLAMAMSVHNNERDYILDEMTQCGVFEKGNENELASVECMLVSYIADYIADNTVCADFENYLDAMRINLSF